MDSKERIRLGQLAQELKGNAHLTEFFDIWEKRVFVEWALSKDLLERENLHAECRAILRAKSLLNGLAYTGVFAEKEEARKK